MMARSRALLCALTLCALLMLAGNRANAAVTVSFELKNGDKVADVVKITAKPESPDGIDKVEFRVDDKLRLTATSVPYVFEWDTLAEKEGAHTLTATAFDSNGQSARAPIMLTVDNELTTGADALAQKAKDALAGKDIATARRYSRRALKADPGNLNAARALASIYVTDNDYDKAIETLDKANGLDANGSAMLELASYRIRRVLIPANAAKFFSEVQVINDLRHKAADINVADVQKTNAGMNTPAAHEAIGDALMNASRYHEAVSEYSKAGLGDDTPVTSINRYALALVMDNRLLDAQAVLQNLRLGKREDAQARAVLGLIFLRQQKFKEAREAVAQDLSDHVLASLIVAAYADGVMGSRKLGTGEASDAVALVPTLGEAQYALSIATTKVDDADIALTKALALSPFQSGPYLDYASQQLLTKRQDRYEQALNLTDLVLKADQHDVQAKLIQALVYTQQKRFTEALPILSDLQRDNPQSPDVITAIGVYYTSQSNNAKAEPYFAAARALDPIRFNPASPPTPLELMVRLRRSHFRADFYLTPAALYPATN